jgi:iron complex outermembrane receptor protein
MTLGTNTGHNKLHTEMNQWNSDDDFGGNSAVPIWPTRFSLDEDNRSWTQEINLASADDGGSNWIVGVFHQQRTTPVNLSIPGGQGLNASCGYQADGSQVACGPLVVPTSYTGIAAPTTVEHDAIFGQYNYAITDELELAIGARYNVDDSHSQTRVVVQDYVHGPFTPENCQEVGVSPNTFGLGADLNGAVPSMGCLVLLQPVNSLEADGVDNEVPTYKIGLNWSPTDTDYFYAFYARGYKAGSFAGPGVAPEEIDDYEFGWKGSLFDGAVTGDLGFYMMDYSGMQGETFVFNDPQGVGSSFTNSNIGDAEMMGIEGSFQTFIGNLGISGSFAFADSEISGASDIPLASLPSWAATDTSFNNNFAYQPDCSVANVATPTPSTALTAPGTPNGNCFNYAPYVQNYAGQSMIQAPDVSYNLGIDYAIPFGAGTLTPRLDYSYTDENYSNLDQQAFYLQDERKLTNVSLTYEDESWTVQAYINNLTDETYVASARLQQVLYGNPQTYGSRAKYNF